MKYIGFGVLILVLFASLFKFYDADLTNNVTAVALMVLLLSLFSDLKEFNFWGLTGTKDLKENLQKLQGKPVIDQKNLPKASKAKVQQAQMTTEVIKPGGPTRNNFLELFFEVERLLRTVASVKLGKNIPATMSLREVVEYLSSNKIFTAEGVESVTLLIALRDQIIQGDEKLTNDIVSAGITLANSLYDDLKNWIKNPL